MNDQELIRAISRGDKKAENEFCRRHWQGVYRIALGFAKNPELAEDWTQAAIMRALAEIGQHKIKNLTAWTSELARNFFIDRWRVRKTEIKKREDKDLAEHQDNRPGPEAAYEKKVGVYQGLKERDPRLAAGVQRSLDYVAAISRLRDELKPETKEKEDWKVRAILEEAQNKITTRFGHVSALTCLRYEMLALEKGPYDPFVVGCRTKDEEAELAKLEADPRRIRLQYFLGRASSGLKLTPQSVDPALNPFIPLSSDLDDFFTHRSRTDIFKLKIDPLKLVWSIWRRGLRKGAYRNNAAAWALLHQFKRLTKGQGTEFVFKSLNEKTRPETLRTKSIKAMKTPLNRDLVNFIYTKSFDPARSR